MLLAALAKDRGSKLHRDVDCKSTAWMILSSTVCVGASSSLPRKTPVRVPLTMDVHPDFPPRSKLTIRYPADKDQVIGYVRSARFSHERKAACKAAEYLLIGCLAVTNLL